MEGNTEGIRFKTKTSEKRQKLQFTEKQATAILDMRLYKLIGLEIEALQAEYEQTMKILLFIRIFWIIMILWQK